jgi:hypothetical protein
MTAQSTSGLDGWLGFWGDWLAGFERFDANPEGMVEVDDAIVVFVHQRAVPKGATNEVVNHAAAVFWFNGERISRIEPYYDRDEGLQAAGAESD